jgi:hypothetical protein
MNEDQNNIVKTGEAIEEEKLFMQSLFTLKYREGPTITWAGWTKGYIQNVSLSKKGEQYVKTKRK